MSPRPEISPGSPDGERSGALMIPAGLSKSLATAAIGAGLKGDQAMVGAAPERTGRVPEDVRRATRVVQATLILAVLLQRLALPVVHVSIVLPVLLASLTYLWHQRSLAVCPQRMYYYLAAAIACSLAGLVAAEAGAIISITSLLLLLILYFPFVLHAREQLQQLYPNIVRAFAGTMFVMSVVGLLQLVAQLLGWQYQDMLAAVVPKSLLLQGYNTTYPVRYGSPIYKSNAFLFLEPSFYSQFLALGVIAQLVLNEHKWRVLSLVAALVSSVSGTGVIVLAVGLIALAFQRGALWSLKAVAVAAVSVALVGGVSGGRLLLQRAGEPTKPGTSGSLRLVEPYALVLSRFGEDPLAIVAGLGPGAADREASSYNQRTGLPLSAPTAQKPILEYGLLSGVLLLVYIAVCVLVGAPSPAVAVSLLAAHLFLSGALLQPQTVAVVLLLGPLFGRASYRASRPAFT